MWFRPRILSGPLRKGVRIRPAEALITPTRRTDCINLRPLARLRSAGRLLWGRVGWLPCGTQGGCHEVARESGSCVGATIGTGYGALGQENMHLLTCADAVSEQFEVRRAFDKAPHVPIGGTSTVSMFK